MIAKNPKTKKTTASEFINAKSENGAAAGAKLDRVPIVVQFDRALLERIDSMARLMGLSRTPFVINAVAEKLRQLEQK